LLRHGDIELDSARRRVTRSGRPIDLARKEFAVLEVLMSVDGATVSAEELLERVWDEHVDPFTNVVRMTIMTLRRKLADPQVVETVIGVGYRMK
jgi:DNA-binding response OmpR family regulator